MAAAAGGGFKLASANMWAVLADEDPGDSEAAKRHEREIKDREAAEYRHQQAVAAAEAAITEAQSRGTMTHGRSEKKARKERSRKQRKKLEQPEAMPNGEPAKTDVAVTREQQKKRTPPAPAPAPAAMSKQAEEEATDGGSDDESDSEEERSSSCRTVVRRLLHAAVAAVLIAFWVHAAATPHTAT